MWRIDLRVILRFGIYWVYYFLLLLSTFSNLDVGLI